MPVRKMALLICATLHAGFCQNPSRIFITGIGGKPDFAPSTSDLAPFQQRTIAVIDHGTAVTFQGVLLTDLLAQVAIPTGEKFRSTAGSYYLLAEGRDGYRAVFA